MKIQMLGCGTSTGVPIPGCNCAVCSSGQERNIRNRTSALIKLSTGQNILIDASPDLRAQALRFNIKQINAVIFTHSHADHILGIDDLRAFNFVQRSSMPCFASKQTCADIKHVFSYAFERDQNYEGGLPPRLELHQIEPFAEFEVLGQKIEPLLLMHGSMPIMGFKLENLAYATDCKTIPSESMERIRGIPLLFLDGLREEQHNTHLTIDEAVNLAEELGAKKTYLIHMSHTVDYYKVSKKLPANIELAYDGLEVDLDDL